jgi:hypothetical protein
VLLLQTLKFTMMATLLVWQLAGVGAGWCGRTRKRDCSLYAVLNLA